MVAIVTREGKGAPLTHAELDGNFTNLKVAIETAGSTDGYGLAVLADGPYAFYRMRDAAGSMTLTDSSGNNFHGTFNSMGMVPGRSPGSPLVSGAAFFPAGCTVTVPAGVQNGFPSSSNLSIEAFVKVQTSGRQWAGIFGTGPDTSNANSISLFTSASSSDLRPAFLIGNTADKTYGYVQSPYVIPFGEWVHLVGTFDGTSIRIYVNGGLAASTAYAKILPSINRPQAFIGADNEGDYTNNAMLAELALYNKTLSAARIAAHYAAAFG